MPARFSIKANASSVASAETATGQNSVSGDTLYVAFNDPNLNTSVSDTVGGIATGNIWTQIGTNLSLNGTTYMRVFRCESGTRGTDHRVKVTASSGTLDCAIFFVCLQDTPASAFDKTAQGIDTSNPVGAGVATGTLSQATETILAFIGSNNDPTTFTETNGFTKLLEETNSSTYWTGAVAIKEVSATTSVNSSWTLGNPAGTHGVIIASFKVSAAAVANNVRVFANGAFVANAFIQSSPPTGIIMRIYLQNNVVQCSNVISNGSGLIKLYANGQLVCNNTIIV